MHAAPSFPARGGSAAAMDAVNFYCRRKYATAKRSSPGNVFDKENNCENSGEKLGFFYCGITASPSKSMSKIPVTETRPSDSGMCDSGVLGSPSESLRNTKRDCFSGKKKANRGLGLRANGGWSDAEGDYGLGFSKGGTPGRRKDYAKKKCNTDGNPGSRLLMGNVTILKRGEKIEDVVATRSSDEEESGRGGPRGKANSETNSGSGLFVREEKAKKPLKKAKAVARVSQVCPVVSFCDLNLKDVGIDKSDNGEKVELVNRLGPDPSVLSNEVGSAILGRVQSESRLSDASSDDAVAGEPETSKRNFGTDGDVKSASTPLAIPRVKTCDSFAGQTTELVEHSNGGFMFEKWAGPAYANSPSPRCLPLPKFFIRHKVRPNTPEEGIGIKGFEIPESPTQGIQDNNVELALPVERSNASMFSHGGFDVFATRNLRRLLQLE